MAVGGGGGGGGGVLSARSLLCQDWIVVVVVNKDQHAGTLTLRYLSGVMSGRLMKGTEKVRSVMAVSVHVTSSHDLCTSFEKKQWTLHQFSHGIVDSAQKVNSQPRANPPPPPPTPHNNNNNPVMA